MGSSSAFPVHAQRCQAAAKRDVIMLDNMDIPTMKEAVDLIGGKTLVEISGNMTEENLSTYANLGADVISSGTITHSVKVLDLSMKNMRIVEGK